MVARGGLRYFLRLAWPVVEGGKQFVSGWHIDAIAEHLEAVSKGQIRRLLVNMPPRHMKLCADSTPIPTPDGYKTHGDIQPGDTVFGPDGQPVKVLAISPKGMADYEVEFSNSETIKCNGDHLWTVYDRWGKVWRTIDTATLATKRLNNGRSRFFIPESAALQFDEKALPLHPYFIGCWLGDGSATKPCLTHDQNDTAHIEKLKALGFTISTQCSDGRVTYFSHQGVIEAIRQLGLYGNKHIPALYATASDSQRLELLAGLIDTDGHVENETGRVRISTCDPRLAEDIERLVFSLGFRAYINVAHAPGYGEYTSDKMVYQIGFQPDRPIPTAIPRKQVARLDFAKRKRAIVSIRVAEHPEIGHCLKVDREDGLYQVGRTNLVTHNSTSISVMWPAWDWIDHPWRQFLFTSYAHDLSKRDTVKSRRVLQSAWFQARWGDRFQFTSDQNTKERYDNNQGGYRIATSVDGKTTGEGGDIIGVDDPHNVREAESPAVRDGTIQWWDESMSSRLNNPNTGAYVVIMQRVHERDMSGHILAKEAKDWVHLCLPARYEPDHPFIYAKDPRKRPGELLWPEQFGEEALSRLEKSLGTYASAGQLQQRPAPREGGTFKRHWFKFIKAAALPAGRKTVRAWDLAGTEANMKSDPDWTVGLKMSVFEGNYYIEHIHRIRETPGVVEQTIKSFAQTDGTGCKIRLPQDPGQAGKAQAHQFVKMLSGYMVTVEPETGSKETRADTFSPQCEAGNVYLVEADWNDTFLAEMCGFPSGAHDDMVDAATGAFRVLAGPAETGMLDFYATLSRDHAAAQKGKPEDPYHQVLEFR